MSKYTHELKNIIINEYAELDHQDCSDECSKKYYEQVALDHLISEILKLNSQYIGGDEPLKDWLPKQDSAAIRNIHRYKLRDEMGESAI